MPNQRSRDEDGDAVAGKRLRIEETLRGQIRDGVLPPGSRLPTRVQLEKRFSASSVTIQRALDSLIAEGFVEPRGRHGTFVVDLPPHLYRYGLVLPARPEDETWNHFYETLVREATVVTSGMPQRFAVYHGVNENVDWRDHQNLIRDLESGRLVGVFFAVNPWQLRWSTSPVLGHRLPRVQIDRGDASEPGVSRIVLEGSWMTRALDHLRQAGAKRIAVISNRMTGGMHDDFLPILTERNLTTRRSWWFSVAPLQRATVVAAQIAFSLLDRPVEDRPDGLIIGDDNLVDDVAKGIQASGLTLPRDLAVVAHANLPDPVPPPLPCRRLGFDARRILRQALLLLDHLREGGDPEMASIPVQFEDEIPRPSGQ